MSAEHFIGIDWGSTHARALLFGRDGALLEHADFALGIKNVHADDHRAAFEKMAGSWRARLGAVPAYLSGMIGSRHGWHEVPYLACPVAVTELAHRLFAVPGEENVFIVPGVKFDADRADVMRGEELQLLGLVRLAAESGPGARSPANAGRTIVTGAAPDAATAHPGSFSLVCIPGTHSKWITLDGAVVREFRTAMTGEVFAAITEHTLFAQLIQPGSIGAASFRASAFERGLAASAEPHGLLNALFAFRAGVLLGRHDAADLPELISGLLIGTEIRHAEAHAAGQRDVAVIGASGLSERYAHALRRFGFEPRAFDPREVAAHGFAALATA